MHEISTERDISIATWARCRITDTDLLPVLYNLHLPVPPYTRIHIYISLSVRMYAYSIHTCTRHKGSGTHNGISHSYACTLGSVQVSTHMHMYSHMPMYEYRTMQPLRLRRSKEGQMGTHTFSRSDVEQKKKDVTSLSRLSLSRETDKSVCALQRGNLQPQTGRSS